MIEYYLQIQRVHIAAVLISGGLFLLRGLMVLGGRRDLAMWAPLRYLVYTNDTVLLTAALMLMTILNQYPFVNSWLTVKVLLLAIYIVIGALAFHGQRDKRSRAALWAAALAVYLYIISVARAHHPLGIFAGLLD